MKRRFIAGGLAAVTALSLSVAPAHAQPRNDRTSSFEQVYGVEGSTAKRLDKAREENDDAAYDRLANQAHEFELATAGSVANDEMFKYKIGTTFDLLLASGIAAALLAILGGVAFQQGLIKLPF